MKQISYKLYIIFLLLIVSVFSIIGYFTNKNTKPVWYSMYNVPFDSRFDAISNSLHNEYEKHGVIKKQARPIQEFMTKEIKDFKTGRIESKHPTISSITFRSEFMAFLSDDTENLHKLAEEVVNDINEDLTKKTREFLNFYGSLIREKIQIDLDYEESKSDIESILESNQQNQIKNLKSFLNEMFGSEEIKQQNVDEIYGKIRELYYIRNMTESSSIDLILGYITSEQKKFYAIKDIKTLEFLENKLLNLKFLRIEGLEDRFNRSPSLKMSVLTFALIGLFIGLLIILIHSEFS